MKIDLELWFNEDPNIDDWELENMNAAEQKLYIEEYIQKFIQDRLRYSYTIR